VSLARSVALMAATRLSHQQRLSPAGRALLRPLRSGRAEVASGVGRGLRFDVTRLPLEHAHAHHMLRGTLEIPVQQALLRHLGPGGVLFDIGANVGFFTLLGARLAGDGGRVFSFEPVPANAASIRAHAAVNGFGQVEVLQLALSDRDGEETMSVPDDPSWAFLEHRAPERSVPNKLEVRVATVDTLVGESRVPAPTVVKLDTEGAESEVLRGMERTVREHGPAIVAEMHDGNAEFVALSESLGYSVNNLEGTEPPAEAKGTVHVLALPSQA